MNWDPVAALKVKLLLVALASKMAFSFGPPRRANVAIAAAESGQHGIVACFVGALVERADPELRHDRAVVQLEARDDRLRGGLEHPDHAQEGEELLRPEGARCR